MINQSHVQTAKTDERTTELEAEAEAEADDDEGQWTDASIHTYIPSLKSPHSI